MGDGFQLLSESTTTTRKNNWLNNKLNAKTSKMKKIFIVVLLLTSVSASSQVSSSTKDIIGKELTYNFSGFIIDLTFKSDTTLYWKVRRTGRDANEKTTTFHINDHTILTGWLESDKTYVSLYSDFLKGETYGYQFRADGRINPLEGTIELKEKKL